MGKKSNIKYKIRRHEEEKKHPKMIVIGIIVLVSIIVLISTSYALFSLSLKGTKEILLQVGTFQINFADGNEINLSKDFPKSDTMGIRTEPYEFTIENIGNLSSRYNVVIDEVALEASEVKMDVNKLRYQILKGDEQVALGNLQIGSPLASGVLQEGETATYKLRIWIKKEAGNDTQGQVFKGKIKVTSTQVDGCMKKKNILGTEYAVNCNKATLTTTAQGSNEKGLYFSNATNDGRGTYYFRGAVDNNYVSFAGFTWRIIRINEDGTIRIMLEDGINNNQNYQFNSVDNTYDKMYYTNSKLKGVVDNWYTTNIGNNPVYDSKVASGDYFCEQAKVKEDASLTSGNATMVEYTSYTPNFKCATDGNNKGVVNGKIGLMTVDEAWHAGGYPYTADTTFYMYKGSSFYEWTMSPSGFNSTYARSWFLYSGYVNYTYVRDTRGVRPVLNLNSGTLVSGNGTQSSPYVVG